MTRDATAAPRRLRGVRRPRAAPRRRRVERVQLGEAIDGLPPLALDLDQQQLGRAHRAALFEAPHEPAQDALPVEHHGLDRADADGLIERPVRGLGARDPIYGGAGVHCRQQLAVEPHADLDAHAADGTRGVRHPRRRLFSAARHRGLSGRTRRRDPTRPLIYREQRDSVALFCDDPRRGGCSKTQVRSAVTVDPEELEDARVVAEDLQYLMDEWVPRLDRAALRRDSPMLRRLLVQGQYGRAWRTLGLPGEPYISAPSFDAMLGEADRRFIQSAFAPPGQTVRETVLRTGGKIELGVVQDIPAGAVAVVVAGYPEGIGSVLAAIPQETAGQESSPDAAVQKYIGAHVGQRLIRGQSLSAYLASPAALITGVVITRKDVITYVANKLGGAHFDPSRGGAAGQHLALLDRPLANLNFGEISNFTAIYAELLSVAEYLAESGDAARFRDAFARAERTLKAP